ncbi:MAG: glycogen/starch/alpha-glucan phosphorylase [Defluviitaleaceae bacterium]|nr:glycogen/starch/alpha-glucan phosphorylase [Defluviitaleaceae bacterium]MCL2264094.1 glycogen/starch/alpha-glucan phosphorylase [Defluviitaleaceae bacterium]
MAKKATLTKSQVKEGVIENLRTAYRKTIATASNAQIYNAVAMTIKDAVLDNWITTYDHYEKAKVKTVYYLSMEFLMGRFMGNAILNLALEETVQEALDELGIDVNLAEESEPDPGLGNGGLGRLAACFLDSLSTMGYPAYGCGIRYHYGIFEQHIENGYQVEKPDNWLQHGDPWSVRREEFAREIKFGGRVISVKNDDGTYHFDLEDYHSVMAVPYDYPVVGYKTKTVNTLRLWDAEPVNRFDLQSFNQGQYERATQEQNLARNLSSVLYPADDHVSGKELRLRQQYFFISATIQRAIEQFEGRHGRCFDKLSDYMQFQLNDTHPTLAVAELMRVLLDVYYLEWDDAWEITRATCAYTNHTIMSEALEKWPVEIFSRLLPRIYMIVEEINRRFCVNLVEWYGNDPERIRKMAICADGQVRMAHLAIVGGHSVNGVAAIHTEILKDIELRDFYEIYPEKFNSKTNGITPRRWIAKCNPGLSKLVTKTLGKDDWISDLGQLAKLKPHADDAGFQESFMKVKHDNKVALSNYFRSEYGIGVDPDSIFDIQVKRLHEYKRQLLCIFHVIDMYNTIKTNPGMDVRPRTYMFSAKAAASYHRAKLIIKLINAVAEVVNNDPTIDGRLKVLFLPNYRVSLAEKLVPAADVSEQISTAGKEASGTGNMKFMLNGAVTIGTLDGANVEMLEEVGDENMFIFGMTAEQVHSLTVSGNYSPWNLYNMDFNIRNVLTTLINGTLDRNHDLFRELYDAMLNGYNGARPDEYYVLQDFAAYKKAQEAVDAAYKDPKRWAKMAIMNTACAGKFSSDRTIKEYADEIWKMKPVKIK